MNQDLTTYYRDRAKEYEKVYLIPEEQEDLARSVKLFQELFHKKNVLEIACGTGYWTEQISLSANSIFATDINETVIEIARARKEFDNVVFEVKDMYDLKPSTIYDALFGGFIWSHIPLQELGNFLFTLTKFLKPDAIIAFIDSKPVKNTIHDANRITKTDEHGNTFQTRTLENGSSHLVLKNFPSRDLLIEKLSAFSSDINYIDLDNYWIVTSKLKKI